MEDDYDEFDEIPDEADPELIEMIKTRFKDEGYSYRLQADAKATLRNDPWTAMQFQPVDDPAREVKVAAPSARRCKWPECTEPARVRAGARGPHPRWCKPHTRERKRQQDNGLSKPRTYRLCCVDYQADPDPAHTGLCPQCDQWRKIAKRMPGREAPSAVRVISAELSGAGWHVEKG